MQIWSKNVVVNDHWPVVGGVTNTADHWWAVSMTTSINNDSAEQSGPTCARLLGEGELMFKKALTRSSGAQMELFDF
jgi:hypothetical protein